MRAALVLLLLLTVSACTECPPGQKYQPRTLDSACVEKCTLAAASARYYHDNRDACLRDMCGAEWVCQ